ncbi:hypothetical protein KA082_02925 [Candidatus Woesebacteria bacterium]|nr:hypothetical protein [Candidatus Woesebacteria bacterium]
MEWFSSIAVGMFDVTNIWSVILRGIFWLIIAGGIIISTDTPRPDLDSSRLKQNLGFILLFLVLSGTLVYLLFGYAPVKQG